jgi:hypothetical protein
MKIMKKVLLSLLIAASMGALSSSAFAEDPGRISYSPSDAVDLTMGKIKVALDAITSGAEGEQAADLIKAALDANKEINANDKVDVARARAANKLKAARTHAKQEALQEAEQELRDAYKAYGDLKKLF